MPADLPSVSVVIATHHRPELLRKALDAVLAQTYAGPVECVVVFDQAPVDESFAGPDVKLVPNARTAGLAGARNTGIDVAQGDLIAFCDDDDEWFPSKLSSQVARLESSGADVVVSGIEVHYKDQVVPRVPTEADLTVTELARRRVMEAHPSTVVVRRTALLERIGLVDEEIPGSHGEDYDWILRAAQAGPIAVVAEPLVKVRWGGQSYFQKRWRVIIDSTDYVLRKHAVLSADPRGYARLVGQKAFAYAALGESREALRLAWKAFRLNWMEQRVYVACVVALRLVTADRALRLAHARGRGI
jgi:glycosyltransferase involved in cell wall biosynthesis